jgi:hypothetical protein
MSRLGLNLNGVPDRPGWFYGVLLRNEDKSLTVPLHHEDGRRLELTLLPSDRYGVVYTTDRHAAAQATIDAAESR